MFWPPKTNHRWSIGSPPLGWIEAGWDVLHAWPLDAKIINSWLMRFAEFLSIIILKKILSGMHFVFTREGWLLVSRPRNEASRGQPNTVGVGRSQDSTVQVGEQRDEGLRDGQTRSSRMSRGNSWPWQRPWSESAGHDQWQRTRGMSRARQ